MIVGNGLIAKSFLNSQYLFNNEIIFASGVSNSLQTSNVEFKREVDLLLSYKNNNKKFVYFSTSSIFDNNRKSDPYVVHKINIENIIKDNFSNYLIYRLPIVVGRSINSNTLANYLYHKIKNNYNFEIHSNSCRYLIDICDVTKYVYNTIDNNRVEINLNFDNKISIEGIVKIFEKILNKNAQYIKINKGDCYDIDNSLFKDLVNHNIEIEECNSYNEKLLEKYFGY